MRLAAFAMLPRSNAATRTFCERPLPYLAADGIKGRVYPPSGPGLHALLNRSGGPLRVPLAALYWYGLVLPRRLVQLAAALRCDAILVQRGLLRYDSAPVLEAMLWLVCGRLLGRTVVYHLDDALYLVKPRWYRRRFRLCSLVVTGNREIAHAAEAGGARVCVVESGIDVEAYPERRHAERDEVTIGWVGHWPELDLPEIVPALAEVCRDSSASVTVVSDRPFEAPELGDRFRSEPWALEREFELFADFDIGVMPLADTPYNRAREAYKLKEYMAAGLPVVCAPVGHNVHLVEHGETGFFATNDDEWTAYLRRLVADAGLRARMGAAARAFVSATYPAERFAAELASLFREHVAGRPESKSTVRELAE